MSPDQTLLSTCVVNSRSFPLLLAESTKGMYFYTGMKKIVRSVRIVQHQGLATLFHATHACFTISLSGTHTEAEEQVFTAITGQGASPVELHCEITDHNEIEPGVHMFDLKTADGKKLVAHIPEDGIRDHEWIAFSSDVGNPVHV